MSSQGVLPNNPLFGGDKPDFSRLVGLGAGAEVASTNQIGLVAAVTNAINFIPPAIAGLYRMLILYRPTATGVSTSITVTAAYKDSTGAVSATPSFANNAGGATALSVAPFGNTGATVLVAILFFQTDSSGTAITLSTSGTFTGTTYNLHALLERLV